MQETFKSYLKGDQGIFATFLGYTGKADWKFDTVGVSKEASVPRRSLYWL